MDPTTSFLQWLADQCSQPGPFSNPNNDVATWLTQGTGQINQKIVGGPDTGLHRFYDPNNLRSGETGYTRGGE